MEHLKAGESIIAPHREYIVSVKDNVLHVDKYEAPEAEVETCQD